MYKMQDNAYLLLPSTEALSSTYTVFITYFIIILVCKLLAFLGAIAYQCSVDIFFVDWEQPEKLGEDVIAWRSTFVANEFNELMTEMRKIHPITTIIWFGFFWVGLGWQYIAQTNPELVAEDNPLEPYNSLMKFFFALFMFWCIGIVQYTIYLIKTRSSEVDY